MRLLTYHRDGLLLPGAVRDDSVVDLSPVVSSLLELIDGGEAALRAAQELVARADPALSLADAVLAAPIPRPRNPVYCVGWNYPAHYEEGIGKRSGQETDELAHPTFFSKPARTVTGHEEPVGWDATVTPWLDYEGELAVVLGVGGRSIPRESAMSHVFGYTLANDVTARDVQRRHGGQWLKGKGMDTYCPLGPVLVTADELGDPWRLRLRLRVNDELRQEAQVGSMIYPIDRLISDLSFGMTLEPGDVLLTGTPPGVGFARDPQVFLQPGDVVEVEIAEIGLLRNPIAEIPLSRAAAGELTATAR